MGASEEMSGMVEPRRVRFEELDWANDGPGIRSREGKEAGARWAIVEYSEGVSRKEWCEVDHREFVLSEEIEYQFDGREPRRAGVRIVAPVNPRAQGGRWQQEGFAGPTRLVLVDDTGV